MEGQTTIIAYTGFIVSLATMILGIINHKRIRSTCCKKELSVSIDVENTTPNEVRSSIGFDPVKANTTPTKSTLG